MRFVWLLLVFGGVGLAMFTNNPALLGTGLLVALVSGFFAVFAFAAARIESTSRPDSALLTPEVLAAVRARAARQQGAQPPTAVPPARPNLPPRPAAVAPVRPPPPRDGQH
jgi:hypothetical protein